jgi:hypothetical protein
MGLFDIFRMGKVLVGTAKAVRNQREAAREIQALPTPQFVQRCLYGLTPPFADWTGSIRPPNQKAGEISALKRLPEELAAFYEHCDGFASTGDFPAPVLAVEELRLGADHSPTLSERLARTWEECGNDSEQPDQLAVLPPDSLSALVANAAEAHIRPSALDSMVPLCEPRENDFVVVLLAPLGERLPAGTILEVEGGMATRYAGFKHWLATRASLFASLPT